jgi:hypothetical protein
VDGTTGSAAPDKVGNGWKDVKKATVDPGKQVKHPSIINTSKVSVGNQLKELL